jgi:hypothetical protein
MAGVEGTTDESGAAVVDASNAVMAIHRKHDYGYHPAGKAGVWSDELSRRNYMLSGGRRHLACIIHESGTPSSFFENGTKM